MDYEEARDLDIGARLHQARKASGLLVADVAQELRRSKGTVLGWESGDVELLATELGKLAVLYGTSAERLLYGLPGCQEQIQVTNPALFGMLPHGLMACCRTMAPILGRAHEEKAGSSRRCGTTAGADEAAVPPVAVISLPPIAAARARSAGRAPRRAGPLPG